MFKIGDKVIACKNSMFDEMKKGHTYTVTDIRCESRDDSGYLCKVDNLIGLYSSNYFELYTIYYRKDKIQRIQKRLNPKNIVPSSFN